MPSETLFERMSAASAAAQASVPGLYAWGVTVVPCAWGRGAPEAAKIAAATALLALAAGVSGELRWGIRARVGSFWGFVVACAVVWVVSPTGLGSLRLDGLRGLAGMLGWALFALVSAAPGRPSTPERARDPRGASVAPDARGEWPAPMSPRERSARGDWAYLAGAAVAASALQTIGWGAASAERALLVRLVALAAGLALLGAAAQAALARHTTRSWPPRSRRLRRALLAIVALGLLAGSGLLLSMMD